MDAVRNLLMAEESTVKQWESSKEILGKKTKRNPMMIAISGVKNSGKTTFLEKLVDEFKSRGYKVAVIKHDGHEFEPDVKGTDTWRLRQAGAYGTAIFSKGQWMVSKQECGMDEQQLAKLFPEADIILLEGFKNSAYPKFEIVRNGNSAESVCDANTLLGLITDTDLRIQGVRNFGLEDWKTVADFLCQFLNFN